MLKKLLKYDFKAVFKYWWIAAISSVVLALAGGWSISIFTSEKDLPIILTVVATIVAIISVMGAVAFSLVTVIFVYTRFYKNFFTDEGYLTFTLPVKRGQLLNSKIITSVVASSLTGFVILFDIFIALAVGIPEVVFDELLWKEFWDEFVIEVFEGAGFYVVIYIIEILLGLLLLSVFTTLFVFCCITIGSIITKKAKIITSIGIYYAANSVFTFIVQMFWLFGFESLLSWLGQIEENQFAPVLALLLLGGVLFIGAFCSVFYSLQYWMLDRKLNLS